jgi:hypothetical protein
MHICLHLTSQPLIITCTQTSARLITTTTNSTNSSGAIQKLLFLR